MLVTPSPEMRIREELRDTHNVLTWMLGQPKSPQLLTGNHKIFLAPEYDNLYTLYSPYVTTVSISFSFSFLLAKT